MSAIKTTQIDGDVSVGRNVAVGGSATVQGSAHLKGNVKVEGWLDAKNIKGANKGIFTTIEKLREAYPMPHDGWWAIVGKALPGPIYVGDGGEWVATGEVGGNPTIDSEQYNEAMNEVQKDISGIKQDISNINEKNKAQDTNITMQGNSINILQGQVTETKETADKAVNDAQKVAEDLNTFKGTKGNPNGIVPLNANGKIPTQYMPASVDDVKDFDGFVENVTIRQTYIGKNAKDEGCKVVFNTTTKTFILLYESVYYSNWVDAEFFGTNTPDGSIVPADDKIYADVTTNKTYRWSGSNLIIIGSDLALGYTSETAFPGNAGAKLQEEMREAQNSILKHGKENQWQDKQLVSRGVINVNELLGLQGKELTFSVVLDKCANHDDVSVIQRPGIVLTFLSANGWQSKQWTNTADWTVETNWTDFGANGESIGNTINVNALCEDKAYALSTAIQAILDLEKESGFKYFKSGVVLTFKTADVDTNGAPIWLAYQFTREVADINPADEKPWVPFGSIGGGKIETSSKPEEGGENAFSTGGAYDMAEKSIGGFDEESDENYIYYKAVNLNGKQLPDVGIKIPKSSGGGGSSDDSTLSIYFEEAAPTVAFGGDIKVNVALRSVSYPDGNEVLGVIRNLSIIDASTGLTLYSEDMNVVSSASATDFKFELDFTPYFSSAASKSFYVQATDADGNTKKKAITVIAVDVTIEQPMALHYTSSTALVVGGSAKSIGQFYKFPNNSSTILCTVEMFYNGAWKTLGESTVSDSYTKSISVNPSNVFGGGEKLLHAAYPVRLYGTEIKSGVKGNTIYSTIMCVDQNDSTPIVAIRFNDKNNGSLRLYDNLTVEVAAYTPGKTETSVDVYYGDEIATSVEAMIAETITVNKQIQGYKTDGSETITVHARSGAVSSNRIQVRVLGSAIGAIIKEGALFGYDFATRNNSETDHTIINNGVEMVVKDSNWSSNGFVDFLNERSLRIAENVTAEIPSYRPFGAASVESTTGCAIQFAFATKNIKDADAKLIECYDPDSGAGFYVCGNRVAISCKTGQPSLVERSFKNSEKHTMAIVVEPSTIYVTRGGSNYSCMKLYLDGEEVGCIGYISNSGAIISNQTIKFNGTDGDLYLYYMLAYDSHYEWAQAFQNYLCKLTDTDAMIQEYEAENVLDIQNRPTLEALAEKGIPYYVVVNDQETFDTFDGDIDTSKKFNCTLYYYDPKRPWRSFKAVNVQWRRQGTTSAKRPIKNDRFYLQKNKGWQVTPIYPEYTHKEAIDTYNLMKIGYVRVGENTIPVKIITVKVDYSDSSNANDCGVCDLMNSTFRALGINYITPAQRAFDGTWAKGDVLLTGLQMNHSTANHPIAAFRSTMESLTDAWFHAKGNWKEDKGEQVALGFKDTPGYNKGCVNYGDFIEYFGNRDESLDQLESRFKSDSTTDKSKLYLLSLYCGENYRFMAYEGGQWIPQSGEMKQVNGKWQITGKVLNPVSGYELLTYDAMNWWQGVGSIDDMMKPTTAEASWVTKLKLGQDTYPMWTRYFECMIDDDQLQIDLAMGRKVPYDLYQVLVFCDSCDYSKEELADTWKDIWKTQMWKFINPYSLVSYYLFTDYLAAVDQQAKNMQPMWFLEDGCSVKDGVYSGANGMEARRMYCNKVYDCDTCNGKDNDGGQTIDPEVDPGDLTSSAYAGRGSVLWNDIRGQQTMYVDQNGNTLSLLAIAETMRSLPDTLGIGAGPFSPKGALHFFVEERMKKWPKVVSSFDGERKYIKYTGYNDLYFYALQGLGLTSLPAFIEQRWRIRDGYYRCGDFKAESGYIGGRIGAKENAVIRFRAGKTGYFGIGNDSGNITQGIYLKAGEEGVFDNFQHGENIMLYIYQADRMSMLDLSEISIDPQFGNTLSKMSLLQELYLGSETHSNWTMSPGNTGFMTNLDLGDMPFLTILDVRQTEVLSIHASKCPRLEIAYADNTSLSSISLAETSPIHTLSLPSTLTELELNNLPELSYPGGMTIGGLTRVQRVFLNNCPNVDTVELLKEVVKSTAIKFVRIPNVNMTASVDMLITIKKSGAIGLDANGNAYEESGQCSGITGRWIMNTLTDETTMTELAAYFPALELHNSQYSVVMFDDAIELDDTQNITNLENGTRGSNYVATGHFKAIEAMSHAYKSAYNSKSKKMQCVQISDSDYALLTDGTGYDPTDNAGENFDVMKLIPEYYYKGINDFKNQKKYLVVSSNTEEPLSTATKINRKKLGDILVKEFSCIYTSVDGTKLKEGDDYSFTNNPNANVYGIEVTGMKQVRFLGMNNSIIGAVFVDKNDKVVSTFNMLVNHALFDFVPGDYVFCNVPKRAARLLFTAFSGYDDEEAIAVDSAEIEAIEPDWVHTKQRLVGVYGLSVDAQGMPRSISGRKTQTGTGTDTTSGEWKYDADGKLLNEAAPTTLNYTMKDFMNLCALRGEGYQAIDYEISKDIANLVMGLVGDRDIQAQCGYGQGAQYTTGALNSYGNQTRITGGTGTGNLIFGIQNFVGCNSEWMDNVVINAPSYLQYKKDKCVAKGDYVVDTVWNIYNPQTGKERRVKGISENSGCCIGRVKFGRYADVIASRVTTDNSKWNTHYSDAQWYSAATGRAVLRSGINAVAFGGLVYAYASYDSSFSYSFFGSRLAFCGEIEIVG